MAAAAAAATNTPPSRGPEHAHAAPSAHAAALSGSSDRTRDWANVGGDGPGGLIAECALASDVADYVRFRAACRSWRRCSPDPRAAGLQDGRFLPRKWIMLDDAPTAAAPRRHSFLNVSTGECIRTCLPELKEHRLLAPTPEGLLLLLHERTLVVRLLNPLTRQLTDLPPVTLLLPPSLRHDSGKQFRVCGAGLVGADASAVQVAILYRISFLRAVATAKPGDERWAVAGGYTADIHTALPFAGRFYCATREGVMVLETSTSDRQRPRLVMAAELKIKEGPWFLCLHLVDNGGELMLVFRKDDPQDVPRGGDYRRSYSACRVDLGAGAVVPVQSFGGRAVFMGMDRAISVSPEAFFPFVDADTIYLGFDCDGETLGYSIADGESVHYKRVHPCTAVDCLCYCINIHPEDHSK